VPDNVISSLQQLMHDECDNKTPVQACDGTPDGSSEVGRSSIVGKGDTLSAKEAEHEVFPKYAQRARALGQ